MNELEMLATVIVTALVWFGVGYLVGGRDRT